MNRNDYRRAFIMLRAALPGYAGHVRLERRTMMGSMYFTASGPDDGATLRAALAGARDGRYAAFDLGAMRRDRRGQASLPYSFDPRNIGGRALEEWQWVVIARVGDGCEVALTGNVEGSRPVDPAALRDAVCALYASEEPAADLPEPNEPEPAEDANARTAPRVGLADGSAVGQAVDRAENRGGSSGATPDPEWGKSATPVDENTARAERSDTGGPHAGSAVAESSAFRARPAETDENAGTRGRDPAVMPVRQKDDARERPTETDRRESSRDDGTDARGCDPAVMPFRQEDDACEWPTETDWRESMRDGSAGISAAGPDAARESPSEGRARIFTRATPDDIKSVPSAARRMGLDADQPWPGAAEPLRAIFAAQPPAETPPEDDFTYVRAPLPEGCGFPDCLIGLRAENGMLTAVRYAVPGRYAPEAPMGLEAYRWVGGRGEGFWTLTVDAASGVPMDRDAL